MGMIAIVGQKGSGKTTSAVRYAVLRQNHAFTNYKIDLPNVTRLKMEHLIKKDKKNKSVNYAFWNDCLKKYGGYDIYIDEIHNIAHSRRAMSTTNILLSKWMAQIRKILGDSETNHLYMISQRLQRIDVSFRDLLDKIVYCVKIRTPTLIPTIVNERGKKRKKMLPQTYILQHHFDGEFCVEKFMQFMEYAQKTYSYRNYYLANEYYKYFDSYELVQMEEDEYL